MQFRPPQTIVCCIKGAEYAQVRRVRHQEAMASNMAAKKHCRTEYLDAQIKVKLCILKIQ